ncbi:MULTISPECIES: hypothetical protein [Bifidobacterium]|uniref:Uncharacterized protein n=1 Tax=Bifidobacterium callitrichos DSM 23973 TaxID=1437609 RepID=A0A086ZY19_9BIFI|nr:MULTISPECIES: hypothetical protein [Bifidobacterium]KFI51419.1 hypothetical protein BCAL_1150 [Bifidobacterium callitrichos DSM 23973]
MSFKDSMVRGLALYGASTMAQYTMGNTKVLADIINDNKIGR